MFAVIVPVETAALAINCNNSEFGPGTQLIYNEMKIGLNNTQESVEIIILCTITLH